MVSLDKTAAPIINEIFEEIPLYRIENQKFTQNHKIPARLKYLRRCQKCDNKVLNTTPYIQISEVFAYLSNKIYEMEYCI